MKADCPCVRKCPRHGDCEKCVESHLRENNKHIIFCMRNKVKAIYESKKD